jgi:phage tail sheath gpL-like
MPISFNNIPDTTRTPGVYTEVDNSRALQGLVQNPHKALIIGQKVSEGSAEEEMLYAITKEDMGYSYFGPGSILARMCAKFKEANPNTELFAIALPDDGAAVKAVGTIHLSQAMSGVAGCTGTQTLYLMINGRKAYTVLTSGWSLADVNSAVVDTVNDDSHLPVVASTTADSTIDLTAVNAGEAGNNIDFRFNYYTGQSNPTFFTDSILVSAMASGANNPDIGDVWAVIDGEQFHYIANPYDDAANLAELEGELEDRFGPLEDLQGHGFTGYRGTQANCTTHGNDRNSPFNTNIGFYDGPNAPEEWAASLCGVAAKNLNNDPARPLQFLKLPGILPPPASSRFTRAEREILLYDGIATWIVDSGGNVLIERCITSYQSNALGLPDPSYLDVQTLATLGEIRFQYKTRMVNRFIIPRFKLADDTFPVQPGSYVVTPKTLKQEIISLFALLRDQGLIENLDDFIDNLVIERDSADANRVNVLMPPDLINQFRVLAGLIQFIL